jgi:adenylate cyclase
MEALNHQLAAEGAPVMRMRLGVYSGMVLAGSIGSSERLEYAISGDTVKCASRIESPFDAWPAPIACWNWRSPWRLG